jgi:hypothetical protein
MTNWCIRKYQKQIQILNEQYPQYFHNLLLANGFSVNTNTSIHTVVDWEKVDSKFTLNYDYEGCEEDISRFLKSSLLINEEYVYIELGYDLPIIKLPIEVFINNWYDFVKANGFLGVTVISKSGKLVLEFTDDYEYQLYSNFKIKE